MVKKIEIPVTVHFNEVVIPPRCKVERKRENAFVENVAFDCYTDDEAPIAMIAKCWNWTHWRRKNERIRVEKPYRLIDGQLYTEFLHVPEGGQLELTAPHQDLEILQDDSPFTPMPISKDLPRYDDWVDWTGFSEEEMRTELSYHFEGRKKLVFVNGGLWQKSGEPFYDVSSYSYHTDKAMLSVEEDKFQYYERHDDCFNANELTFAREKLKKYNDGYENIDDEDRIEVLIPSAVGLMLSNEREALEKFKHCVNELESARSHLSKIDGAVIQVDAKPIQQALNDVLDSLLKMMRVIVTREARGHHLTAKEESKAVKDKLSELSFDSQIFEDGVLES